MPGIPPLEMLALVKIIDELDYYQVLHLAPDASQGEVKRAYFANSRTFHPDANRHLEGDLQHQCMSISKRVTEAYCVLRDPRRRSAYDAQRAENQTETGYSEDVLFMLETQNSNDEWNEDGKILVYYNRVKSDGDLTGKREYARGFFTPAVPEDTSAFWPAKIEWVGEYCSR